MSLRIILNSKFFLLICSSLLFADDGQIIDRKSLDISIENENINKENYKNMHYLSEVKPCIHACCVHRCEIFHKVSLSFSSFVSDIF